MAKIPQTLLPYRKEIILEALEKVAKYFEENQNDQAVKAVKTTIPFLDIYVDDEKAIIEASKNFADDKYVGAIKKYFGDDQEKQYKYVLDNF